MWRMRLATIGVFLALVVTATAQIRLETGKPEHRRIESGADSLSLDLKASEYVEILAEQTSVDIVLRLFGPDGKQIQEVNHVGIGGTELMIELADRDGEYKLEVCPVREGSSGEYVLTLAARRTADAHDRQVAEADVRFRELIAPAAAPPGPATALEQVADKFAQLGAVRRQARALLAAGGLRAREYAWAAALDDYSKALDLWRTAKDPAGEGDAALRLGNIYGLTSRYEKAIEYYQQVLTARRAARDHAGEGGGQIGLGFAYGSLGQYEKSIDWYEQALKIAHEVKDAELESRALNNLGLDHQYMGQFQRAVEYFEQSLTISRTTRDRLGEGRALNNIANCYSYLEQFEQALAYHQQALTIAREVKDRAGEARALTNLGRDDAGLGQYENSIRQFEPALAIWREVKDRSGEGLTLNNLGAAYQALGQSDKAIGYLEQALTIRREIKDRNGEGSTLSNLGTNFEASGQYVKAIEYQEQALTIFHEVGNRAGEGWSLSSLGVAYRNLEQYEKSIEYSGQALAISREFKIRDGEHQALDNLMRTYDGLRQPRLAVFYGKQAVNVIQSIRSDIRGLAEESRKSFFESKQDTYRHLADILVSQGRLVEAQQVLNLLKEQEFFDYIRRNELAAGPSGRADLTSEESEWAERYRAGSETLVAKGTEMEELRERIKKQPALADAVDTQRQMQELQKDLEAGNRAFQQFLGELQRHFAAKPETGSAAIDLRDTEALKSDLGDLKHGSVAIYTLVTPDRYVAILITPRVQRAYETKIKSGDLNQKILDFRGAIENPNSDPLPVAQELYRILIPDALAEDLKQARAETLMWSLDGPLRYVPVAALYDGKQYLIEKYRTAVFTPASNARLKEAPQTNWRGVAFGVSEAHPGFEPLPAVSEELRSIVREKPGEQGVLDGKRFMDAQFTRASLDRELALGYPVVHVASHFQFRPGDETRSFLLLGDGGQLTLADLKAADTIFAGVDLLTLSACSTGLGDVKKSDGSEVEGFGVLAQRKGAKAVIASLWPVADTSTGFLMREFYRIRQSDPKLTKIEALRRAQLRLLNGGIKPGGVADERGVRVLHEANRVPDYRHPYYWAPFFLMGNWL
jgi:CHAT domain-containing protein/tetratricopeptide (TPR) repeat protein